MGRPRLDADEKLVPAKVTLRPDRFDMLTREADRLGRPLSHVLRERIDRTFREPKTQHEE